MKSEETSISKLNSEEYNATCISCGSTDHIQLWPHRNVYGQLIGFVFACSGCVEIVKHVTLKIKGIRG